MKTLSRRRMLFAGVIVLVAVMVTAAVGVALAQEQGANPRSDTWRAVRQGAVGYTSVDSEAHEVLIQTEGQLWRRLRNGPLATVAPWVLAGVLAVIALFFIVFGKDRLEEPRTGELIPRFTLAERVLHWTTAVLFIVLALTGLSMLFGRAVLIPLFGQAAFAGYMQVGMFVHNVSGPLFLAGIVVEFAVWVRDNIPKPMDLRWFKTMGGMIGKGPRPHAEKVNGGEKAWFWLMVLAGIGVGVTGVILDFPIWGQSRQTLQIAHLVHAAVAVLFVAASFGHIYIGTIGAEGTFEGMWRGKVDAAWAKQHQDLWYAKMTGGEGGP